MSSFRLTLLIALLCTCQFAYASKIHSTSQCSTLFESKQKTIGPVEKVSDARRKERGIQNRVSERRSNNADDAFSTGPIIYQHSPTRIRVQVINRSEVKKQCDLGTCHLQAWAAKLEQNYGATGAQPIHISTQYLAARYWLNDLLKLISITDADSHHHMMNFISLGSEIRDSRNLIIKFGLVPNEVWKAKEAFETLSIAIPMEKEIHQVFERLILKLKQNKFAPPEPAYAAAKEETLQIFNEYIGPMPETFSYRGQTFTPQTFQEHFFPEFDKSIVVAYKRVEDKFINLPNENERETILNLTGLELSALARRQIDKGHSMVFSYLAGTQNEKSVRISTRKQKSKEEDSSHAVLLVGYETNLAGTITGWIIQNSWGKDAGDKGFFVMSNKFFLQYSLKLAFFRNELNDNMDTSGVRNE